LRRSRRRRTAGTSADRRVVASTLLVLRFERPRGGRGLRSTSSLCASAARGGAGGRRAHSTQPAVRRGRTDGTSCRRRSTRAGVIPSASSKRSVKKGDKDTGIKQ